MSDPEPLNYLSIGEHFQSLPLDRDSQKAFTGVFPIINPLSGKVVQWYFWPTDPESGAPLVSLTNSIVISSLQIGNVGVLNTDEVQIDPATEETLLEAVSLLEQFSFSGGALVVTSNSSSSAVTDFQENDDVLANQTVTHDYIVPSGTFDFKQAWITGYGNIKAVVQTGPSVGSLSTVIVGFNTASQPNIDISLASSIGLSAGYYVRLSMTNLGSEAMSIYSTIVGNLA